VAADKGCEEKAFEQVILSSIHLAILLEKVTITLH